MSGERVFVYGSLVDPGTLDGVLGHRHTGERLAARLDGYVRMQLDTYPFPFIVPQPGGVVNGVLLVDLSVQDLQVLDRYEDVDTLVYERRVVEVEVWGCGPHTYCAVAHTYVGGRELVALIGGR